MNITDAKKLADGRRSELLAEAAATAGAVAILESRREDDDDQHPGATDAFLHSKEIRVLGSKLRDIAFELQHEKKLKTDNLDSTDTEMLGRIAKSAMETVTGAAEEGGVFMKYIGMLGSTLWAGLRFAFVPIIEVLANAMLMVVEVVLGNPYFMAVAAALGAGYFAWNAYKDYRDRDGAVKDLGKPPAPEATGVATEAQVSASANTNVRLNNPGNIEWRGQTSMGAYKREDHTGRYAGFRTQAQGLSAIGKQLEIYHRRDNLNTIRELASKYAPAVENDTARYIKNVSAWTGIGPDDKIDFDDQATLAKMIKAIVRQENGATPYTETQYQQAAAESIGKTSASAPAQDKDATKATPAVIAKAAPDRSITVPVSGRYTSPFGDRMLEGKHEFHQGIDIAAPSGRPIFAANTGIVTITPGNGAYGNSVDVVNQYLLTRYGHLSAFSVKSGDYVVQGQKIGEVGSTGHSTGPHLHFEVRPITTGKEPDNPANYLSLPSIQGSINEQTASIPLSPDLGGSDFIKKNGKIIKLRT